MTVLLRDSRRLRLALRIVQQLRDQGSRPPRRELRTTNRSASSLKILSVECADSLGDELLIANAACSCCGCRLRLDRAGGVGGPAGPAGRVEARLDAEARQHRSTSPALTPEPRSTPTGWSSARGMRSASAGLPHRGTPCPCCSLAGALLAPEMAGPARPEQFSLREAFAARHQPEHLSTRTPASASMTGIEFGDRHHARLHRARWTRSAAPPGSSKAFSPPSSRTCRHPRPLQQPPGTGGSPDRSCRSRPPTTSVSWSMPHARTCSWNAWQTAAGAGLRSPSRSVRRVHVEVDVDGSGNVTGGEVVATIGLLQPPAPTSSHLAVGHMARRARSS